MLLFVVPHEVPYIKKIFKKEIITPGIRLIGDKAKDQKRITTPKKLLKMEQPQL